MILLNTHIWVNWIFLGRDALKPTIASAIEDTDTLAVSAIYCFEVTALVKGRKLELPLSTVEWIKKALELSPENKSMLWMPEGLAHGFVMLSDVAECIYKTTDYFANENERVIALNDSGLNIDWLLTDTLMLSIKNQSSTSLKSTEVFA